MATVTQSRFTPEELLNITDRPMPELVDGDLVEREMGIRSDSIAATCLAIVWTYVKANQLGRVNGAQGSYQIFPDDPKKVRIPDVSFTRRDRLPNSGPIEGHGRIAPDLVIEVTSPNDTVKDLTLKIKDFLVAGVPLIWIVHPDAQSVQVYHHDGSSQLLQVGDFLDGEDVLPGFRCAVADLFA